MARVDVRLVGQGLALAIGITIGFIATRNSPNRDPTATQEIPVPESPAAPETVTLEELVAQKQALEEHRAAQRAEYDAYLERHDYSREALVAIALLSGDLDYLLEAAERYPDDPQVQLLVIGEPRFPGDKSEWYRRFRDSQPDNLLASLLLGSQHFREGESAEALEALRIGASQASYRDFSTQNLLAMESALIELGHSPLEAKQQSANRSPMGPTLQIQEAIVALTGLIDSNENTSEQQELALLGAAIGNQLSQGAANSSIINRLSGLAVERGFLKRLDPELESESLASTPAEALQEIRTEWERVGEDTDFALDHFDQLDESQKIHYLDRKRTLGEANANTWLRTQFAPE